MNYQCPSCHRNLEIGSDMIGQKISCQHCGVEFVVENPNLTPCPDCFALISKRANTCPHCGAVLRQACNAVSVPQQTNVEAEAKEYEVLICHPSALYFLPSIIIGVILTFVLVGIPILISTLINIYCTVYRVTSRRVIVKTGFFNKKQTEIWIKDMRGVNLQEDLWQRIIGTGSVAIGTAATAGAEIQMNGLKDAQSIVETINGLRTRK